VLGRWAQLEEDVGRVAVKVLYKYKKNFKVFTVVTAEVKRRSMLTISSCY